MTHVPHSRSAFTLLELSMVIIIVTLIVGGILIGRGMIESANLQTVIADFGRYREAAISYRTKYGELPGDHTNATSLTSADAACPTPAASNNFTTATCNGNGDGVVGDNTGNPLGAFTNYQESLLFWQHLLNEGLIQGQYNGRRTTAINGIILGVNAPESKAEGGSFQFRNFPTNTDTAGYFRASYGHVFFYGLPQTNIGIPYSGTVLPFNGAALTPDQAKSIDVKIDDGKPGMGKVLTSVWTISNQCPTSAVETTATYDGTITMYACALIFITGF